MSYKKRKATANTSRTASAVLFVLMALTIGLLIMSGGVRAANTTVLQDNFNDNALDPAKWTVNTNIPTGSASVVEQNARVELTNRGYLNTAQQFDPVALCGIRLTGEWTFAGAADDFLQISTRSDGIPDSSFGEVQNGVEFIAFTSSVGEAPNLMTIVGRGAAAGTVNITGDTGSLSLVTGVTYAFDISDDGSSVSFTLTNKTNPSETRTVTATSSFHPATNLVTFHNRELCCGGTHVSHLDNVVIEKGECPCPTLAQTSRAYVPNIRSNNVSVIDAATNTVIATIPVGTFPAAVAVTPNGAFAYVTNLVSNTVSVISAATNTVIATVPVGTQPFGLAVTPNGAFVYVASSISNSVSVIDTATNTVVTTIAVTRAQDVAITPNGAFAYVTAQFGTVTVIDTATNTVTATVPGIIAPTGIAFTPNGAFAYVVTPIVGAGTASVISTATNTVVATITVGSAPFGVDITPNGAFAYVANSGSNNVSVIDTATNTVVATIPVGASPQGVAINPDGTLAYVSNFGDDNVSVIDTATNTVTTTISVGDGPAFLALGTQNPIASLIAQVQTLIAAGTLTQNQGAGLIDKLNGIRAKVDDCQSGAACNQLNSFISQVNAFINNGSLSQAQGQSLINAANAIKADLGCP